MNKPWLDVLRDPKLCQKELTGREREPLPAVVKPRYKPAQEERKRESWLSENRNHIIAVGAKDPLTYRQREQTAKRTTAGGISSSYRLNTTALPATGQEQRPKRLPQQRDRRRDVDLWVSRGLGAGLNAGPKTCAHGDTTPEGNHDDRRKAYLCRREKGRKLSFWRLDHIPVGIDVTQMTFLCISDHQISFVPAHLASCVNLRTLLLTGNALRDLGQGVVEQLHLLKKLWVNQNNLDSIYDVVSSVQRNRLLEDLNLQQNPGMKLHRAAEDIMESLPLLKYLNGIELTPNVKHRVQGRYPDVLRDPIWDSAEAGPISLPGSPTASDKESQPSQMYTAPEPAAHSQRRSGHASGQPYRAQDTRRTASPRPLIPFTQEVLDGSGGTEQERWELHEWRAQRHSMAREEDARAHGLPSLLQGALLPDGDVAWEDWKSEVARRPSRRSDAHVALELEAARRLDHAAESRANALVHGEPAHLPGEPFRTHIDGDVLYHWSHVLCPAVLPDQSPLWGGLFPDGPVTWESTEQTSSASTLQSADELEAEFLGWDDRDDRADSDGNGGGGGRDEDMLADDLSMLF